MPFRAMISLPQGCAQGVSKVQSIEPSSSYFNPVYTSVKVTPYFEDNKH